MSDNYYDESDDFGNGPKALRELVEKLQKEQKKLQEALDSEREARAKAEKTAKSQSLTSILKDKGIKPGLAKWLEKDEVDATTEAVEKWLEENGEFFNIKPAPTEPEAKESTEGETGEANVPPELEAALRAAQGLDASGVSPSEVSAISKVMSVNDDPAKGSFDQLVQELAAAGLDIV